MTLVLPSLLLFANFEVARAENFMSAAQSLLKELHDLEKKPSTHEDWHLHESTRQVLKGQLMSGPYTPSARCEALSGLRAVDLTLFREEIENSTDALSPECKKNLILKIDQFFALKRYTLSKSYRSIARKKLSPCSERNSKTFGPETELFVSPRDGQVLTGVDQPPCTLTFTFDDGPHPQYTSQLLDTLANQNLRVHFFVVGKRVEKSRDILVQQHQSGHLIGNHTMTHANLRNTSFSSAAKEIEDGFDRITETISHYLPFFRFPYGNFTRDLRSYLNHFGRVEFFWNIDTLDWKIKDPEALYAYTLDQIEKSKRGIILFHDIQPQTIVIMPYLLDALHHAGYSPTIIRPNIIEEDPSPHVH